MWYLIVFTVIGIALVAVVLWRVTRPKPTPTRVIARHHTNRGTERASYTDHGSRERRERKRRRSQSAHNRSGKRR